MLLKYIDYDYDKKKIYLDNTYTLFRRIMSLIISIFAAIMSWECNSIRDLGIFMKTFYAMFAYIFGEVYLLYYIIFIYGTCK